MCSPHFLNLPVGLLKQLLVHQLGLTEKSTQEDWPHSPGGRTASLGVQADGGTQNPENTKACHPVEAQMPFRTGTGDISTCYSPRTSTESSAPRDSVALNSVARDSALAFQESQASDILVMDHMIMTPEMPPSEPEGGLDESGEHFFDAREAHSDDNPSEGDGAVKKEEKDVNLRISGKFLSHLNFDFDRRYLSYVLKLMLLGYPSIISCVCLCIVSVLSCSKYCLYSMLDPTLGPGRCNSE